MTPIKTYITPRTRRVLKNIYYTLNGAALIGVIVFSVRVGRMLAEEPYLSFPQQPFPIAAVGPFRPGDAVPLLVHRCNSSNSIHAYPVARRIISADGIPRAPVALPATWIQVDPGCTTIVSHISAVPAGTAPGIYYIEGRSEVSGSLRAWSVPWQSAEFRVVAADPPRTETPAHP